MFRLIIIQLAILCSAIGANISVPTYEPVPKTAAGPVVPTPPAYRIQPFGDGAYMVTDGLYQALFFEASESVTAVDSPPTIGENMIRAIRNVTDKPISHVVYSHHHADHIGGAYLYGSPQNVTYIASIATAQLLAETPDYTRPAPAVTFEQTYTLNVGNQTLQLDVRGDNHCPGNTFIYAPLQKVLVLIDIVYPGWTPFNQLGEVQSVPGYIKAHDYLLDYDFEHYVGGHLGHAGTRQDVLVAREYLRDLYNTSALAINMSAQANNSLSFPSVIAPESEEVNPYNDWATFSLYIDVLADWVQKELLSRWGDRLFGVDVYGKSHAETMLESVRIDFGHLGPFGVRMV